MHLFSPLFYLSCFVYKDVSVGKVPVMIGPSFSFVYVAVADLHSSSIATILLKLVNNKKNNVVLKKSILWVKRLRDLALMPLFSFKF